MWPFNRKKKVIDTLNCLTSESGRFYLDNSGIVQRFEPADGNMFDEFYDGLCTRHIDTLIVPCGTKGFCDQFMRSVRVRQGSPESTANSAKKKGATSCVRF